MTNENNYGKYSTNPRYNIGILKRQSLISKTWAGLMQRAEDKIVNKVTM